MTKYGFRFLRASEWDLHDGRQLERLRTPVVVLCAPLSVFGAQRSALERRARPTTTGDTRLALAIIIVIAIIPAKVHQQAICAMQHAIR